MVKLSILNSRRKIFAAVLGAAIIVILVVVLVVVFTKSDAEPDNIDPDYRSVIGKGAIVANGPECAAIGREMFEKNGSVIDATIAVLLCEGVACAQSTGLGGGFILTMYHRKSGVVETLNARERAPLAATKDMYVGEMNIPLIGGRAAAVPGELAGYWALHQKYGVLPWSDLFEPTIKLCEEGHIVSPYLGRALRNYKQRILDSPSLSEIYINPVTNDVWVVDDRIKRPKLAETLKVIAREGASALYNGTLTKQFVADVQSMNGIITEEDMGLYAPTWDPPVKSKFMDDYTVFSSPPPSSGSLLIFLLNVLNKFVSGTPSALNYHRMTETFKYGYAKRSELGDSYFETSVEEVHRNLTNANYAAHIRSLIDDTQTYQTYEHYGANFVSTEDHGTAHISIVAPNGDAVSVTGTINFVFGCRNRSMSTGIILNNEMDDFSTPGLINGFGVPPSPSNFIKPQKRPMSSMNPAIIVNKHGDVEMVVGGAGGTKITTQTVYLILQHLVFKKTLVDAMATRRLHHQLAPMVLEYEDGFEIEILNELVSRGHKLEELPNDAGFASLTAIAREGDDYSSIYDTRRNGSSENFSL